MSDEQKPKEFWVHDEHALDEDPKALYINGRPMYEVYVLKSAYDTLAQRLAEVEAERDKYRNFYEAEVEALEAKRDKLTAQLGLAEEALVKALEDIVNENYRGNRPNFCWEAEKALTKWKTNKGVIK